MIRLALTDLDDTLIPFGAPCASHDAIRAIRAMLTAGLRFGPMTGRIPVAMSWMFSGHQECYATGGFVNGQMIYVDGELVRTVTMPGELIDRAAQIAASVPGAALAVFDVNHEKGVDCVGASRDQMSLWGSTFHQVRSIIPHATAPSYVKANIHFAGSREELVALRDRLREEIPDLDFVLPSQTMPIVDIQPKGWSKGEAVKVLADEAGLALDEIAVFGDSENDLNMIRAVPNSVAVQNAGPEVLEAARWHIGDVREGAVPNALFDIADAAQRGRMPAFMRRS